MDFVKKEKKVYGFNILMLKLLPKIHSSISLEGRVMSVKQKGS